MLGGEKLWQKAKGIIAGSKAKEDLQWRTKAVRKDNHRKVAKLVAEEEDERMRIWIRVELGGERMAAIGRELGYSDGSGVHRVVQRLNQRAETDKKLKTRIAQLRRLALI